MVVGAIIGGFTKYFAKYYFLLSACLLCLHDVGDHVSNERWDDIKNPIDYPVCTLSCAGARADNNGRC